MTTFALDFMRSKMKHGGHVRISLRHSLTDEDRERFHRDLNNSVGSQIALNKRSERMHPDIGRTKMK
jgi:hypothetical protein